ncbi:unnamed protein product [Penicillium salamii]|nr:unnamed protein product [Penicillium salamii]
MINRLSCRAIKTGSQYLNYPPPSPSTHSLSTIQLTTNSLFCIYLLDLLLPEAMTVSSSYASRMKAKNIIQKRHTISTKNNIEYIKRK